MKVIKSKRLANYLTEKGFKIEKVDVDRENSKYMIFLFKKTNELLEAMNKWTLEEQYSYEK